MGGCAVGLVAGSPPGGGPYSRRLRCAQSKVSTFSLVVHRLVEEFLAALPVRVFQQALRNISQGVSGRGGVVRFGTALGIASRKISGIINNFLDRTTKYVVETPAIEFIVVPARSAADQFHEICPSIPT